MKKIILLFFIFSTVYYAQDKKHYPSIIKVSNELQHELNLTPSQSESIRKILADYQNSMLVDEDEQKLIDTLSISDPDTLSISSEENVNSKILLLLNSNQKNKWEKIKENWWQKVKGKVD